MYSRNRTTSVKNKFTTNENVLITSELWCCFPSELIVRWAQDFDEFQESELATVELVMDSDFEAAQVVISGSPRQIPDSDPSTLLSLEVLGPDRFPGK